MTRVILSRGMGLTFPSGRKGLRPVDLRIEPGELVAILGPNGSGKSTLLRLLATDLQPTEGALELFGSPVEGSLRRFRRRIGYAPDTPVHYAWLSGEENARFFAELARPDHRIASERLARLFEAFRLGEDSGVPVSEYSFGMKRKLLLLEALASAPPLLLLDEPTVGLDPSGALALRTEIQERAGMGGTVVIASNDTRELPLWADRILFLHRGALIEDAPLPALLGRLRGKTRIEIDLAAAAPVEEALRTELGAVCGVEEVLLGAGRIRIRSSEGGGPLPELLQKALRSGLPVRDVRVREPDLGDLFRTLTGEDIGFVVDRRAQPDRRSGE